MKKGMPTPEELKKMVARVNEIDKKLGELTLLLEMAAPGSSQKVVKALLMGATASLPDDEYANFIRGVDGILNEGCKILADITNKNMNPSSDSDDGKDSLDPTKLH